MKNLSILFLVTFVSLSVSCSGSDDSSDSIIGTWKLSGMSAEITGGTDETKNKINKSLDIYQVTQMSVVVTYTNDGKVLGNLFSIGGTASSEGVYTYKDGKLTVTSGTNVSTADCKVVGNTLTVKNDVTGLIPYEGVTKLIFVLKCTRQ